MSQGNDPRDGENPGLLAPGLCRAFFVPSRPCWFGISVLRSATVSMPERVGAAGFGFRASSNTGPGPGMSVAEVTTTGPIGP
ncbi:hypothetical protein [Actinobaculum sp. 352]|uniref:hypothetical protein n=1 Tax=Actinobaculum sp. 352 TaxID=2490946 RepID=UPI0019D1185B|nr:hypothetical protein [Actinobaculum sp. 352]